MDLGDHRARSCRIILTEKHENFPYSIEKCLTG